MNVGEPGPAVQPNMYWGTVRTLNLFRNESLMTSVVGDLEQNTDGIGTRSVPMSSEVVSGITAAIDTISIMAAAAISYKFLIGSVSSEIYNVYLFAVCFIWITIVLLFQFAA